MLKLTSALTVTGFVAASLAASTTVYAKTADTKTKHRPQHHSIRVVPPPVGFVDSRSQVKTSQRSWLDPGAVMPQNNGNGGVGPHYVQTLTTLSQTPDQTYEGNQFGNETLPRRFEIPSDQGPLIDFWTPAPR
jgi:hypothetical protein